MPFKPPAYPTPTIHRFTEEEIERICRFVLKDEYETKDDLNKIIKAVIQEARRDAIYPPTNVFGDELCGDCRVRYHLPEYNHCLECNFKYRTETAEKARIRDSLAPNTDEVTA